MAIIQNLENMNNKSKLVISKLNKETVNKNIEWHKINTSIKLPFDGDLYGCVYECNYKNRCFRIYKYTYYAIEPFSESQFKTSDVRLELIDNMQKIEWEFENDSSLVDLYENVRIQVSKINDIFNEILDE